MIIIITILLTLLFYFLLFGFAFGTLLYVFSNYLGTKIVVNEIFIHAIWFSLVIYSLIAMKHSLATMGAYLELIFDKNKNKKLRKDIIKEIKEQIKSEIIWIKNSIIAQLLMQICIFIKNVVKLLFKFFFRR
uniref:Uncharacterized protein n=1 Tax=Fomitiporia mediterranea TaxID=208960 RepID=A0A5B9RK45_9AGAM|nr:hypothetical protein Fomme_000051 [Fomitiporia mediterranea]QEG57047.1 hypothetical protein Fomme_000051 [Fomitiporia mediterranea]